LTGSRSFEGRKGGLIRVSEATESSEGAERGEQLGWSCALDIAGCGRVEGAASRDVYLQHRSHIALPVVGATLSHALLVLSRLESYSGAKCGCVCVCVLVARRSRGKASSLVTAALAVKSLSATSRLTSFPADSSQAAHFKSPLPSLHPIRSRRRP
jgi:hypothetical protein